MAECLESDTAHPGGAEALLAEIQEHLGEGGASGPESLGF